jgi:tRNA threonylcarbamoyladenosine biosynthesis protein TsaB
MESFRNLLHRHSRLLVIDTASSVTQVGLLSSFGALPQWAEETADSGEGIFACLEKLNINVKDVDAIAFCDGPGSILGIRTTAAVIRSWLSLSPKATFAYGSLELLAWSLGEASVGVVADARRELWHVVETDAAGRPTPLRKVRSSELPAQLRTPETFKSWAPLPPGAQQTPYRLAQLLPRVMGAPVLRPCPEPDALLVEPTSYVRWAPKIHRANQV